MAHYHPVSYETEARIRQGEKLEAARRHRRAQVARGGRKRSWPGVALLGRVWSALSTMAGAPRPLTPEREGR